MSKIIKVKSICENDNLPDPDETLVRGKPKNIMDPTESAGAGDTWLHQRC